VPLRLALRAGEITAGTANGLRFVTEARFRPDVARPRVGDDACLCRGRAIHWRLGGQETRTGRGRHSARDPSRCDSNPINKDQLLLLGSV